MMRKYALERGATLLRRMLFLLNRAAELRDPESIHDLRVSIRRFQQCLRVFHAFFPHREVRKIRQRLREVMELSGEVRNRDVALDLVQRTGLAAGSALSSRLTQDRKQFQGELVALLDQWSKRAVSRRWGSRLGL
jgi:CHAD domain-containing protein